MKITAVSDLLRSMNEYPGQGLVFCLTEECWDEFFERFPLGSIITEDYANNCYF